MKEKIAVVIVNYNAGDVLLTALRSVFESSEQASHVIIVDNASTDGSLERCRESYPKITYIVNSHNLGFAAGANIGARYALERLAKYVVFMNPDATIGKECLGNLTSALQKESVGIATPLIYRTADKKIWFAGGKILYKKQRAIHQTKMPESGALQDIEYATGCVMAVRDEVFTRIGLFDEKYFLYYEDADLSVRAHTSGLRVVLVPSAYAWHSEQSENNMPQKTYFLVLSGLHFFAQHTQGTLMRMWMRGLFALRRLRTDIRALFSHDELSQAVQQAFKDYYHERKAKNIIPYR